jgi:hypothetical protein
MAAMRALFYRVSLIKKRKRKEETRREEELQLEGEGTNDPGMW